MRRERRREADLRRHARQPRVGERDRHHHHPRGDAGDQVGAQPGARVGPGPGRDRDVVGEERPHARASARSRRGRSVRRYRGAAMSTAPSARSGCPVGARPDRLDALAPPGRRRPAAASRSRPARGASGRVRPLSRSVAPADDSRIVPGVPGHVQELPGEGLVLRRWRGRRRRRSRSRPRRRCRRCRRGRRSPWRRSASGWTHRISPLETEWTVPRTSRTIVRRRPTSSTVPSTRPEADDVALEVLALGEDEDPHQVVEDDALAGQGERGQHEPEAREHRPQVEDPEDHDDRGDEHAEPQELARTGPRASRPDDRSRSIRAGSPSARPAGRA